MTFINDLCLKCIKRIHSMATLLHKPCLYLQEWMTLHIKIAYKYKKLKTVYAQVTVTENFITSLNLTEIVMNS